MLLVTLLLTVRSVQMVPLLHLVKHRELNLQTASLVHQVKNTTAWNYTCKFVNKIVSYIFCQLSDLRANLHSQRRPCITNHLIPLSNIYWRIIMKFMYSNNNPLTLRPIAWKYIRPRDKTSCYYRIEQSRCVWAWFIILAKRFITRTLFLNGKLRKWTFLKVSLHKVYFQATLALAFSARRMTVATSSLFWWAPFTPPFIRFVK